MEYIYALINKNEVVYIGRSKNVKKRVLSHKDKKFESFEILNSSDCKDKIKKLENFYIKQYNPKYNKILNGSELYMSIKEFSDINNLSREEIIEMVNHLIIEKKEPLFLDNFKESDLFEAMTCNISNTKFVPLQVFNVYKFIEENY